MNAHYMYIFVIAFPPYLFTIPLRFAILSIRLLQFDDNKEHVNIVFIGHVDAGKSTIGGHLM